MLPTTRYYKKGFAYVIPTLQMRKLRLKETKYQGHPISSHTCSPQPLLLATPLHCLLTPDWLSDISHACSHECTLMANIFFF